MSNSMFDLKGQLNASSVKDAFATIAKFAAAMDEGQPSNSSLTSPSVSDNKRDELISRAILTNEGKLALAQAMANPIRRNLDYHGIARRALVVDLFHKVHSQHTIVISTLPQS